MATILVVEDEPIIAFALEDMLIEDGAAVVAVGSLEEGLDQAEAGVFDFAILDINRMARKLPDRLRLGSKGVRFVFASGYGDAEHPEELAHVTTLTKPMSSPTSAISQWAADGQAEQGNRHKEVASSTGNDYGLRMRTIASDHAADLKADLRDWLIEQGHEVADLGPDTADRSITRLWYKLAAVVADGTADRALPCAAAGLASR